jgi:hypothetical protein
VLTRVASLWIAVTTGSYTIAAAADANGPEMPPLMLAIVIGVTLSSRVVREIQL